MALASLLAVGGVAGFQGETCNAEGARAAAGVATRAGLAYIVAGVVSPNGVEKWTFALPEGENYAAFDGARDPDLIVCTPGAALNRHACASGNVAPNLDSCLLSSPGNPGSGPPILGPGEFILYVFSVWSTEYGYPNDMTTAYVGAVFGNVPEPSIFPLYCIWTD